MYEPTLFNPKDALEVREHLDTIHSQIKSLAIPPADNDPFVACNLGTAEMFNALVKLRYERNADMIRETLNVNMRKIIKLSVKFGIYYVSNHVLSHDEVFEFAGFFDKVMSSIDHWRHGFHSVTISHYDALSIATHTIVDQYIKITKGELKTLTEMTIGAPCAKLGQTANM